MTIKNESFLSLVSHSRSDLHLVRKFWHCAMGLLVVAIYLGGVGRNLGAAILASVFAFDFTIETLRLRLPPMNRFLLRYWGPLMRSHEVYSYSGTPYYLASAAVSVLVFPREIAALSILYLAFGDPMASLFGILYGSRSLQLKNGKSLIGTLAGAVVCGFVTIVFLTQFSHFRFDQIAVLSVIGAMSGVAAELLPFDIDDNFSIPIVSGFILWLSFIVLGV